MTQKKKFDVSKISMKAVDHFKSIDMSKYQPTKKPKKVSRSPFDNGLDQIHTTFK